MTKPEHFLCAETFALIVKDSRPVNLNLTTIRFPLAAIASILHRISGVFLFAGIAGLLYLLDLSLESPAGFALVQTILEGVLAKFLLWAVLSALAYHFVAGCKHLLMDLGWGETKSGAKTGASLTLAIALLLIVLTGVWIW